MTATVTAPFPPRQAADNNGRVLAKSRVQLDLSPRAMQLLTALKDKTEAGSYAEVIRNALKLYDGLIAETEKGNGFLIQDPAGKLSPFKMFL